MITETVVRVPGQNIPAGGPSQKFPIIDTDFPMFVTGLTLKTNGVNMDLQLQKKHKGKTKVTILENNLSGRWFAVGTFADGFLIGEGVRLNVFADNNGSSDSILTVRFYGVRMILTSDQ